MEAVPLACDDIEFCLKLEKAYFGGGVGCSLEVELIFDEGSLCSVVFLDLSEKSKDDGDESEVSLGGVNAFVRDRLGKALFPVIAGGIQLKDVVSDRGEGGECIASLSFRCGGRLSPRDIRFC